MGCEHGAQKTRSFYGSFAVSLAATGLEAALNKKNRSRGKEAALGTIYVAKASESQLLPIRGHLTGSRAGAQRGAGRPGTRDAPRRGDPAPLGVSPANQSTVATGGAPPSDLGYFLFLLSLPPELLAPPFFSLSRYLLLLFWRAFVLLQDIPQALQIDRVMFRAERIPAYDTAGHREELRLATRATFYRLLIMRPALP